MASKKSFAVIGLGQFGISVVEELVGNGMDVIAIYNDEEAVKKVSSLLPTVAVANATDEESLKELGIKDVDSAIVAFGSHIEASILTTVILKELGVKSIVVRVDDPYYLSILKKLGATEVIMPQKAAGIDLANRLGNEDFKDFYKLDDKYSVVSIIINSAYVPQQLKNLSTKDKYGVNVVLINRNGRSFVPGGNDSLLPDDTIFVVGSTKEIRVFREAINGVKTRRKKK
jgi:trk system potassium uptake protein TrkA